MTSAIDCFFSQSVVLASVVDFHFTKYDVWGLVNSTDFRISLHCLLTLQYFLSFKYALWINVFDYVFDVNLVCDSSQNKVVYNEECCLHENQSICCFTFRINR